MEVLNLLTTVLVLIYTLLRIGTFFQKPQEVKAFPASQTLLLNPSFMREVQLKGLDYGPPSRYFVQGQSVDRVWLLVHTAWGTQHSMTVKPDAIEEVKSSPGAIV